MLRRERRIFTKEFKQQMVDLYLAGKPWARAERIREDDLTASAFDKWMRQAQIIGSFSEKENVTPRTKRRSSKYIL